LGKGRHEFSNTPLTKNRIFCDYWKKKRDKNSKQKRDLSIKAPSYSFKNPL